QPSASMAGQVFDINNATNSSINVVNYTFNTNIIINGSSPAGTAGDTDNLLLKGTDPANPATTGDDLFDIDLTRAGMAGSEWIQVSDDVSGAPLYNIQNFSNFNTININTLGESTGLPGTDIVNVIGANDGSVAFNLTAGDRLRSTVKVLGTADMSD